MSRQNPLHEDSSEKPEAAFLIEAVHFCKIKAPTLEDIARNQAEIKMQVFEPLLLLQQQERALAKSADSNPVHAKLYAVYLYLQIQDGKKQYLKRFNEILEYLADNQNDPHALLLLVESRLNSVDKKMRDYVIEGLEKLSMHPIYRHYANDHSTPLENIVPTTNTPLKSPVVKDPILEQAPKQRHGSVIDDLQDTYFVQFIYKVREVLRITREKLKPGEKEPALFEKIDAILKRHPQQNKSDREKIMNALYNRENENNEQTKNLFKKIASHSKTLTKLTHRDASNALLEAMREIDTKNPTIRAHNGIQTLDNYLQKIKFLSTAPANLPRSTPRS